MVQYFRLRLLLAVTFVSLAAAQSDLPSQITAAGASPTGTGSYPPCAAVCLADATGALECSENDSRCLCSHQKDVRTSVEQCLSVSDACSPDDASAAASYYEKVCQGLGLDQDGEPLLAIATGGIATAPNVAGPGPTSPSSTPSSSATASSTPTASTAKDNDDNEKDDQDDGAMSIATVAGIAVGCTFIVVAVISGLIFMYIRRRDDDEEMVHGIASQVKPKPESDSSASSFKTPAQKVSEKTAEYSLTSLPSPQPPPKYTRSNPTPTIAARRNNHSAKPLPNTTPSATLNNSSYPFPFGDKNAAEASVTSLALPNSASKPVSAMIVQPSPVRSQFSEQGSIYSVSSIHSEELQVNRASEARRSRPNTFYNLYTHGAEGHSNTDLSPAQQAVGKGQGSLRRNKFDTRVDVPLPLNTQHTKASGANENPFTTPSDEIHNPFNTSTSTIERPNPLRSHPSRKGQNPLTQRPGLAKSTGSFGKFDFEIDEENRKSSGRRSSGLMRNSFFSGLDLGFGKS
ncbi:uncharacterized protein AB675_7547 [Cyphellophora attinorum]|uniref:CFEM domain-containing protein n=1 Tax=Cyphellophora attinorum TaxID=1664694 RepID=A0A0N1HA45_9EURO|nr:uncharacterized protein AB675_7547 [Phialophora attinorum]KPI40610.1 hypothetical protein AB675_7547 [Phialophora attinorum]